MFVLLPVGLLRKKGKNKPNNLTKMSRITDFMISTNDAAKPLPREDTEAEIDIKNPNTGSEQNEEIKQLGASALTTDKQRERQEAISADNMDDIGKIEKL